MSKGTVSLAEDKKVKPSLISSFVLLERLVAFRLPFFAENQQNAPV